MDTNIFVYSIDGRDERKHAIARKVVRACSYAGCKVALQVLCEFFVVVTRKSMLSHAEAAQTAEDWQTTLQIVVAEAPDLIEAVQTSQRFGIQFFDAMLLATVRRSRSTIFFSEELQHGRDYGGVTVLNPFLLAPEELERLLA